MASERVRAQTNNSNMIGVRNYNKIEYVNVIEFVSWNVYLVLLSVNLTCVEQYQRIDENKI